MKSSLNIIVALTLIFSAAFAISPAALGSGDSPDQTVTVYFFYGDGCPHCALVEPFIDNLSAKYPQVDWQKLEVWYNSTNQALFQEFNSRYGVQNPVVPEVYIGDKVLIGEDAIKSNLEPEIQRQLSIISNSVENNSTGNTSTGNATNINISPENTNNTSAEANNDAVNPPKNSNSTVASLHSSKPVDPIVDLLIGVGVLVGIVSMALLLLRRR